MSNNVLTKYDGWAVSYLPDQSSSILDFEKDSQDETALLVGGSYFILNGDWQEHYAACVDFKEALRMFIINYGDFSSTYTGSVDDAKGFLEDWKVGDEQR
jgi:hypothetical protein